MIHTDARTKVFGLWARVFLPFPDGDNNSLVLGAVAQARPSHFALSSVSKDGLADIHMDAHAELKEKSKKSLLLIEDS
ncbi:MAG: hypothetical protein ACE5K2_07930, partial [Candidatus Zixiibacteriota bacterium]